MSIKVIIILLNLYNLELFSTDMKSDNNSLDIIFGENFKNNLITLYINDCIALDSSIITSNLVGISEYVFVNDSVAVQQKNKVNHGNFKISNDSLLKLNIVLDGNNNYYLINRMQGRYQLIEKKFDSLFIRQSFTEFYFD